MDRAQGDASRRFALPHKNAMACIPDNEQHRVWTILLAFQDHELSNTLWLNIQLLLPPGRHLNSSWDCNPSINAGWSQPRCESSRDGIVKRACQGMAKPTTQCSTIDFRIAKIVLLKRNQCLEGSIFYTCCQTTTRMHQRATCTWWLGTSNFKMTWRTAACLNITDFFEGSHRDDADNMCVLACGPQASTSTNSDLCKRVLNELIELVGIEYIASPPKCSTLLRKTKRKGE